MLVIAEPSMGMLRMDQRLCGSGAVATMASVSGCNAGTAPSLSSDEHLAAASERLNFGRTPRAFSRHKSDDLKVQLGPRPYYLVDDMDDGKPEEGARILLGRHPQTPRPARPHPRPRKVARATSGCRWPDAMPRVASPNVLSNAGSPNASEAPLIIGQMNSNKARTAGKIYLRLDAARRPAKVREPQCILL